MTISKLNLRSVLNRNTYLASYAVKVLLKREHCIVRLF